MNIFVVLTLILCLPLRQAVRLRENLNVLVPNNDVNFHAQIKKLLNDDDVDPKDLNDNEIESLSALNSHKASKLLSKSSNKVFDDKNKNIEENQIDRELSENSRLGSASLESTTKIYASSPTVPAYLSTPNFSIPEWASTTNPRNFSTPWSTTSSNNTFPSNTTTTEWATTSSINSTEPTWTPTLLPDYNATMPESTWPTSNHSFSTQSADNITTPVSQFTSNEPANTTLHMTFPPSTTDNASTSSLPSSSETITHPSTPTEMASTTTSRDGIYDDLQSDECLLGKADLEWVDDQGKLTPNFNNLSDSRDLSSAKYFNGTTQYLNFTSNFNLSHTVSAAGESLSKCFPPRHVLINCFSPALSRAR